MRSIRPLALVCSITCCLALADSVSAQSTLFNIPSTDVVARKHVYTEFDFFSHLEDHEDGGFQAYTPRVVAGVGGNVEVGTNVAFFDALVPDQPVELQPNIKWQFYNDADSGVAAAAGAILYTPIANGDDVDTFGSLYFTVSKKFKGDHGPRLTGGAYGLVGRDDDTGTKGGAILGYEQPLHPKVTFVTDWLSGNNRFGYVTPGFAFALPRNSYFYAGYSVGNSGRKNNALFLYYGITF